MAALTVVVVSADREVWTGEATRVVARTTEGEIGILAGHEPLMGLVAGGEVRILTTAGATVRAQADGGFLSVANDRVSVVADAAEIVD
ncbi:MAG: F0F1 ATP synthase subunit epsilon [Brevibacterium yomogidense]|uniref:ATP synthase epsilon chain n=1 Tax=Brevibacterium yomogidense TaxID=946573 RepID=A0A1X6XMJ8_9MICO|nr:MULTISPECIES: F0F1 ATP synthase subunit epsilon [Brevibacterium]SLN00300.1 ATP synthase epsilon chain [Brevibacterium yomogidense]SMX74843.1 ATP synthase F1 subcomplex epsilon subunit [Brevibacterium sp. Mu109]